MHIRWKYPLLENYIIRTYTISGERIIHASALIPPCPCPCSPTEGGDAAGGSDELREDGGKGEGGAATEEGVDGGNEAEREGEGDDKAEEAARVELMTLALVMVTLLLVGLSKVSHVYCFTWSSTMCSRLVLDSKSALIYPNKIK